ncbi:SpaH/EbpB family LPXTG-anchored major pilin [Butyrivibrio sp. AE2015]|uniref:SpaH/EbpB family LPXTG-anchored major pilin n=1 Tax=Butyrivibrio sp. AE2015 TaxID=1280663 RepID=UPI0003B61C4A|nr:SpaH/EbpB family LPXTG-anchored major pilin [Butyrivibrio sp. AE2015]
MKGLKKLLTGVLAATMIMAGSLTAFASDGADIKIENASEGQTYNLYKIFTFEPSSDSATNGVYKLSAKWEGFSSKYFTVSNDGFKYITLTTDANGNALLNSDTAAAFAQEALAWAKANKVEADATEPAPKEKDDDFVTTVEFSSLDYGYYLVDSSLGVLCALNTNTPNAVFKEKNGIPDIDKKVTEDSTNSLGENNDAQIGQTIYYVSNVNLKVGGEDYIVTDKMTDGLDFTGVTSVTVGEATLLDGTDYSVVAAENNRGFVLTFSNDYLKKLTADATAVISYTAVLNENAELASDTNDNEIYLKYNNGVETVHRYTHTKTYPLDIIKYAAEDETEKTPIAGAHFTMKNTTDNSDVYFVVSTDGATYTVVAEGTEGATNEIVTIADKKITVNGLDADTYELTETQAPEGRNLLDGPVEVTINNTVSVKTPAEIAIPNGTGSLLPSTGGIGTTIFYIIGGILIVAGFAYFIVRRKADAE